MPVAVLVPPNYVFPIFAFISFFLCLIRFPMQWHAWNIGIHLFLAWVGLSCLCLGINSIIWSNNTVNWAPVWCDISSRFIAANIVGIPATMLSINRRLYFLASPTSVHYSETKKRREIMIDIAIGIGLPIISIALSFFAQASRFQILEDYGCNSSVFNSWVAVVIVTAPPILLEVIAGLYGCLSIHAFYKLEHRIQALSSHRNLDPNRYKRLMFFSFCDLLTGIPVTVAFLYFQLAPPGLDPFPGLKQEHDQLSQIQQVPAVFWRATTISELSIELNRWIIVASGFVFFAIFGLTRESCNNYRAALQPVVQAFMLMTGIKSRSSPSSKAEGFTSKTAIRSLPPSVDNMSSSTVV